MLPLLSSWLKTVKVQVVAYSWPHLRFGLWRGHCLSVYQHGTCPEQCRKSQKQLDKTKVSGQAARLLTWKRRTTYPCSQPPRCRWKAVSGQSWTGWVAPFLGLKELMRIHVYSQCALVAKYAHSCLLCNPRDVLQQHFQLDFLIALFVYVGCFFFFFQKF